MNYKSAILIRLLYRCEYYCLLNPEERTEEQIQNVVSFFNDINCSVNVITDKEKINLVQKCHFVTDQVDILLDTITEGKIKMIMPNALKGYKCPNKKNCSECEFHNTKCIVYSTAGKKKYEQWKKEQLNKIGVKS